MKAWDEVLRLAVLLSSISNAPIDPPTGEAFQNEERRGTGFKQSILADGRHELHVA